MSDFYAAGLIHDWPEEDLSQMKVLCLYSHRYANYRFLGGNSICGRHGRGEVPKETLQREVALKSGATILESRLCHQVILHGGHQRYFYLVLRVSLPDPGQFPKETVKLGHGLSKSDSLVCDWVPLEEFVLDLYPAQLTALGHIIVDMATDKATGGDFYKAFPALVSDCLSLAY
jgi:hypothetical protein